MWGRALLLAVLASSAALAAPRREPITIPTEQEIAELERARDKRPNRSERRDALALAYYRFGRAAFDRGDFTQYEKYLGLAMDEWIESLRLDPEDPEPHTLMSMVAMYQGRIDDALESAHNARVLAPTVGQSYANVAAVLVKAGASVRQVENWLLRAERWGVNPGVVEWHYCFLRWREGEEEAAARHFYRAMRFDPEIARVWNAAPVAERISSFEDLRRYCCGSPACGPYYESICSAEGRTVARRELPEETALRELRIEMERRRALGRIYQQRRDLDIEVKSPETATEPEPSAHEGGTP
jgi:tetratricopeptide (TPR) repeat protein